MKVITIESKAFQKLSARLDRFESALEKVSNPEKNEASLLSSAQVCEYLQISRRTLARLTSSGELPFTKSGRKLLFIQSDIEKFLGDRRREVTL